MNFRWLAAAAFAASLLAPAQSAHAGDAATLFRVFLTDGTSLVSYGEYARVGDRVVFSMPTTAEPDPPLHLVNIAADRVDWGRTERYANAARSEHYISTRAEDDYAALTDQVATTLNEVATVTDAAKRLAIVESARKALAAWPAEHFNYRFNDVRQMLLLLDEAIADLKSSSGNGHFDLSLVAYADAPIATERVLPPPTPMEAIQQTLMAARLADSPAERTSLLSAAVAAIDVSKMALPADWAAATRAATTTEIDAEVAADRAYLELSEQLTADAVARAKMADVHGVQRIADEVGARDTALGRRRPDAVAALIATVNEQLDAARRLRLARDRFALRIPELRRYRLAMRDPTNLFASLAPALENIKALAGSSPGTLAAVRRRVREILNETHRIAPPEELRSAHALLVSAVQMAGNAAEIRREATLAGDMARAWDASSAAAGALMLGAQARSEIQAVLRRPELR